MNARIKDVAKKSGVSVATVSRVLNGGDNVSDKLKQTVLKAIEELNYSPSHIARSLVTKKTNIIGVIVPDLTSSFFSTILSSIEENASANNYNIMVCNIAEDLDKELKYLNLFKQIRVDAMIVMHEKTDDRIKKLISGLQMPVVFCSCRAEGINVLSIIINDYAATYDATKYLIDLGHRNIAYLGGDLRDITSGENRYEGYKKAMLDNGLLLNEQYIRFGDYKIQSGYTLMEGVLRCNPKPTAILAASDDMAVGALGCIIDKGYKVPEDFSVMGFDGSSMTEIVRPRLTSMHQPIKEMGAMAIKILMEHLEENTEFLDQIVLKHKIVERESCKRL